MLRFSRYLQRVRPCGYDIRLCRSRNELAFVEVRDEVKRRPRHTSVRIKFKLCFIEPFAGTVSIPRGEGGPQVTRSVTWRWMRQVRKRVKYLIRHSYAKHHCLPHFPKGKAHNVRRSFAVRWSPAQINYRLSLKTIV